jgi:hypothetical protein
MKQQRIKFMAKTNNVFISHHGKDDRQLQSLKQRLRDSGYNIRNSSVDSTKHRPTRPSDAVIARHLRKGISWAGTFICLVGEKTYSRPWVNYEIKQAYLQGKRIIGVWKHGCANSALLPESLKKYGGPVLGWNSVDKLGRAITGENVPSETPSGNIREPIYNITRVSC